MIPLRLRISGFTSYSERQPAEIDFSELDLACISGPNGAGKSSLLDAITYALYGKARKADEAIINSNSKRAEVTLDFKYEDQVYRVRRGLTRGKGSQVEFFIQNPEAADNPSLAWRPLTKHTVSETNQEIEDTLRLDYQTFVNASFFLQGKADAFATLKPADRKKILFSILGLDQWEKYREAAATRRSEKKIALDFNQMRLDEAMRELEKETELHDEQARLETKRTLADQSLQLALAQWETQRVNQQRLDGLREKLQILKRQAQNEQDAHNAIEKSLAANKEKLAEYEANLKNAAAIEKAHQDYLALRKALNEADEQAARVAPIEKQRSQLANLLANKEGQLRQSLEHLQQEGKAIEAQQSSGSELDNNLKLIESQLEALQGSLVRRVAIDEEKMRITGALATNQANEASILTNGKKMKERMQRLAELEGAPCPFCGQALAKHDRERLLTELEAELGTMRVALQEVKDQILAQNAVLEDLETESRQLKGDEVRLQNLQLSADRLIQTANKYAEDKEKWETEKLPILRQLEADLEQMGFLPQEQAKLKELDGQLAALGYDPEAHNALREAEREGRKSQEDLQNLIVAKTQEQHLSQTVAQEEKALSEKAAQLSRAEADVDAAAMELAVEEAGLPSIRELEDAVTQKREELAGANQELGGILQQIHNLGRQRERKAELEAAGETLRNEMNELRQLEKAFGKDGVPSLLIEQELPELERQANELLQRLSNYSMNVQLTTQRDYKSKTRQDKMETLDILISDGAAIRDYETYSGGEAFRINFAIRLALSKVLAQRAGARLQTLVIDEGFGNQDAEGRQRLIEAINTVRDEFAMILIITHIEELKEQFPARIEVSKNAVGSVVEMIPG